MVDHADSHRSTQPVDTTERPEGAVSSRRPIRIFTIAISALACFPTVIALFARQHWCADLFSHFPLQYFLILLPVCLLAIIRRSLPAITICSAALLWNGWQVASCYVPPQSISTAEQTLKVMSVNLLTSNHDHQDVQALIDSEQPDVILLIELSPAWQHFFAQQQADYPHQRFHSRTDAFGIGVLCKTPAATSDAFEIHSGGPQSINLDIPLDRQSLRIIATHTLPPVGRIPSIRRNTHLSRLIYREELTAQHLIVAGDLNVSPWSPHFRDLLTATGLRDSRQGFGNHATWPSRLGSFGIPIDHVLVSPTVAVKNRYVRQVPGSDHQAVFVEVGIVP